MKRTMTPPPEPVYGLGKPIASPTKRTDPAIVGRPNWFTRPDGVPYYVEPPKAQP